MHNACACCAVSVWGWVNNRPYGNTRIDARANLALEALRAAVQHSAVHNLVIRDIFESIQLLQETNSADFRHRRLQAYAMNIFRHGATLARDRVDIVLNGGWLLLLDSAISHHKFLREVALAGVDELEAKGKLFAQVIMFDVILHYRETGWAYILKYPF